MSPVTLFWTCAAAAAVLLLVWKCICRFQRPPPGTRLPPMPPASSILGHVELMQPDFYHNKAIDWVMAYGPVFRLKLNFKHIVVLNDIRSVKDFYKKDEVLKRPECFDPGRNTFPGLATFNGEVWAANKRFCMTMLHDLGFAKTSMEEHMMTEFRRTAAELEEARGAPLSVGSLLMRTALNNILKFFIGSGFPDESDAQTQLLHVVNRVQIAMLNDGIVQFVPGVIRALLQLLPFTRKSRLEAATKELYDFLGQLIQNYKGRLEENKDQSFVGGYLKKIEEARKDPSPKFQYRYLIGNMASFIAAGTTSVSTSMECLFVLLAMHEDGIQAIVRREIDEAVGRQQLPTWDDRKRTPFTMACVWELERWKRRFPTGAARETSDDVVVDNLFIPKGTMVLLNMFAVHNDPKYWKEPERFDPNRFLNDDGSFRSPKPDSAIPFSFGKRSCPGETFALMEIYLLLTFLMQKFRVTLDNPPQSDRDDKDLKFYKFDNLKLRFQPRLSGQF
ncbi:cytochrome P450 2G1-like [Haemaphysalis longicornis]